MTSWFLAALVFLNTQIIFAQILPREDQQQDAGLEDLYDKFEGEENKQVQAKKQEEKKRDAKADEVEKEFTKLSELATLAPFDDIAVIQKRYLPKTQRFEFSGNATISTNNQYFNNMGANARVAYYFTEKYGIELVAQFLGNSKRGITEGLIDNQRIQTRSLVEPEGFYGALFKWTPIYGKMALFQETIIPFDLYFTPGFGTSQTLQGSSPTVSLGAGQLFALSKSFGVRWDFMWNFYSADVDVTQADGSLTTESRNQNDLFVGLGVSFFLPEAKYR